MEFPFKKVYLEGVWEKRIALDEGDDTSHPSKKLGWPIVLGKELDHKCKYTCTRSEKEGAQLRQEQQSLLHQESFMQQIIFFLFFFLADGKWWLNLLGI